MPKKKIAETEPVVAAGAAAASPAKAPVAKKARAPRASAKAVTHKHKKTTITVTTPVAEPAAIEIVAVPVSEPSNEEIARLAYSYWESRGYQGGSQEEDWYRAVQELRHR